MLLEKFRCFRLSPASALKCTGKPSTIQSAFRAENSLNLIWKENEMATNVEAKEGNRFNKYVFKLLNTLRPRLAFLVKITSIFLRDY